MPRLLGPLAWQRLHQSGIEILTCLIEVPNDPSILAFENLWYKQYPGVVYYTKRTTPDV